MKDVKKSLSRLLIFLLVFIISFISFTSLASAKKDDFKAYIAVYQESDISPTGKCYGPYFTPEKKLKVETYEMRYKDSPQLITEQDVDSAEAQAIYLNVKLVRRVGAQPQVSLKKGIDNGVLYVGEIDIGMYKSLKANESATRHVRVRASTYGNAAKLFDEKKEVVVKKWIDEEKCYPEPSEYSFALCLQIPDEQSAAQERCIDCFNTGGIWTAIGCVPQTSDGIVATIMNIGVIMAGTIVLIMILVGAFMLSTSQGDPKKTQEAKELITSAIIGLLFVIFSIVILQFIGVYVFRIPGFGE
jgi:hypothetical protein